MIGEYISHFERSSNDGFGSKKQATAQPDGNILGFKVAAFKFTGFADGCLVFFFV